MEEPVEDPEAVLAAYRERKRKALEARDAAPGAPDPASASQAPAPAPAQAAAEPVAPRVAPAPPRASPPTAPAPSHHPAPVATPLADPQPTRALDVHRPAALSSSPGATLSALGPVFRLSDALLKDTRVSLRGSPRARAIGVTVLLAGLGLAVVERRQAYLGSPVDGLGLVAVLLILVGIVTAVLGSFLPRNRRLAVRLAASQQEEWKRIRGETRRLQTLARVGFALAALGLLLMAVGYAIGSLGALVAGGGLTLAGVPMLVIAQVRRSLARRLYVQTLVLSGLEASGIGGGAGDERVQPVILALDRLLGALPEAEVQAFLATPQARAYLELVDEATRSQRGP